MTDREPYKAEDYKQAIQYYESVIAQRRGKSTGVELVTLSALKIAAEQAGEREAVVKWLREQMTTKDWRNYSVDVAVHELSIGIERNDHRKEQP